ncbi:MAG: HAD-IIIA family hydrolase [Epsilonproteobacteria bacterium]|nr:HAD-IIIA family hydrolase [Campylobacterota bacterium]
MRKRVVIFDMDGTLIDSSVAITESINFVRLELGLSPFSVQTVTKLINMPDQDLPKLFYEDVKPYSECRKIFEKHYYQNCIDKSVIYSGVKEMLKDLDDSGFELFVATNAYEMFAKRMLKRFDIEKYFKIVLGSDSIGVRKPDPKVIRYILEKFDAKEDEAVLIGDSLKDEEAAKNAGIEYIFVDWGFGECERPSHTLSLDRLNTLKEILSR